MKCIKHPNIDAVGTCQDCGVGLCSECIHNFTLPICIKCNSTRLVNEKSELNSLFVKNTVIGVIVALYFFAQIASSPTGGSTLSSTTSAKELFVLFISVYFGFFTAYGWTFINSLKDPNTVTVRVNEGLLGLFFRKGFKFIFACLFGGFVGPYQIWKMKKRIKEINDTQQAIQRAA